MTSNWTEQKGIYLTSGPVFLAANTVLVIGVTKLSKNIEKKTKKSMAASSSLLRNSRKSGGVILGLSAP